VCGRRAELPVPPLVTVGSAATGPEGRINCVSTTDGVTGAVRGVDTAVDCAVETPPRIGWVTERSAHSCIGGATVNPERAVPKYSLGVGSVDEGVCDPRTHRG